jgi:hypothetical protein
MHAIGLPSPAIGFLGSARPLVVRRVQHISKVHMERQVVEKRINMCCWLATACLLTIALAGYTHTIGAAIVFMAVRVVQISARTQDMTSFPVQVHVAYLLLLVVGSSSTFAFVHWNLLVGTWVYIITGYCVLARCLALLPWNRSEPLTWPDIAHVIFSRPVENILQSVREEVPERSRRKPGRRPAASEQ